MKCEQCISYHKPKRSYFGYCDIDERATSGESESCDNFESKEEVNETRRYGQTSINRNIR